jgi:hypothetical protein
MHGGAVFHTDDLRIIESRDWIQTNVSRFFPDGFDSTTLIMSLADECFRVTRRRVAIERVGDWILLDAEVDWLLHWEDPFNRLTPLPQLGSNKVSLLAVAAALRTGVATWSAPGWEAVVGIQVPTAIPLPGIGRVVALHDID